MENALYTERHKLSRLDLTAQGFAIFLLFTLAGLGLGILQITLILAMLLVMFRIWVATKSATIVTIAHDGLRIFSIVDGRMARVLSNKNGRNLKINLSDITVVERPPVGVTLMYGPTTWTVGRKLLNHALIFGKKAWLRSHPYEWPALNRDWFRGIRVQFSDTPTKAFVGWIRLPVTNVGLFEKALRGAGYTGPFSP